MSAVNQAGARVYDAAHQNFNAFRAQIEELDRFVEAHQRSWPSDVRMTWAMYRDEVLRFLNEPVADMQAARQLLQAYIDALVDIRRQWPRTPRPDLAPPQAITPTPAASGFTLSSLIPWALGGGILLYALSKMRK